LGTGVIITSTWFAGNNTMTNDMQGVRVVVTAAAAGIGAVTAKMFMRRGAKVHICDIDNYALEQFLDENPTASGVVADVSNEQEVDDLFVSADEQLGGLDFMINNAGIAGPTAPVHEIAYADWQQCIDVNLSAAFLCSRQAIPRLKSSGGGIVNLSSTAGMFGFPRRAPYSAAKWAIIGFTKTLAMELGPLGIRANAICPGAVSGPRMDRVIAAEARASGSSEDDVRAAFTDCTSLRTFVTAEDIAETIGFLCSDLGAKISGQAIPVDGHSESVS
jgi:NAD(P)-dependent dehydrogenase (short-subunit alcohol dehydrogenase family)